MVSIFGVCDISVWYFAVDAFALLRLRLFYCADFFACVPCIKFIEPISQGSKLVIFPRRIYAVVDCDISYVVFGEYNFYQFSRFQIITSKP